MLEDRRHLQGPREDLNCAGPCRRRSDRRAQRTADTPSRASKADAWPLAWRVNGPLGVFISDVPGDDPRVIGSGLMGPAPGGDGITSIVGLGRRCTKPSMRFAGRRSSRGLTVNGAPPVFDDDAVRLAIRFAHELHLSQAQVSVWGGESTLELLRESRPWRPEPTSRAGGGQVDRRQPDLALLAAGTDGTDGPTEDAGAVVDGETVLAHLPRRLRPDRAAWQRADSNPALAAAGDLCAHRPYRHERRRSGHRTEYVRAGGRGRAGGTPARGRPCCNAACPCACSSSKKTAAVALSCVNGSASLWPDSQLVIRNPARRRSARAGVSGIGVRRHSAWRQ